MKACVNGNIIEVADLEQDNNARIEQLKSNLAETDYIACKIAEGVATKEEYSNIIAQRQMWRNEINKLEKIQGGDYI